MVWNALILLISPLLEARAEILKKDSLVFLVDLKTPKGHFKIKWPLAFKRYSSQFWVLLHPFPSFITWKINCNWLYFFNRKIELQIRDSRLDWKQKWWPTWPKNDFSPKRVERECLLLWPSLLLLLSFCLNMNLLGGSFNNYVDQILPIFDHLPPIQWTIVDILHKTYPLFTWPRMDFLLNTYLPIPVHVGFEWPIEK